MHDPSVSTSRESFEPRVWTTGRWYALALLGGMYLCHGMDRQMINVIVEPLKREFSLSDTAVGALTGLAWSVAFFFTSIPLGWLIDRVNRRNLLIVLLSVWSALTALCGLSSNYFSLVVARIGVGAAEAGGQPAALSLISDLFAAEERSAAIGVFYISTGIGICVSFLIGGALAAAYGWRAVFFVAGIPGFIIASLLFSTFKEPQRRRAEAVDGEDHDQVPALREVARYVLRSWTLLHLTAAMVLTSMTVVATWVWCSSILIRLHHLPLTTMGAIAAVAALVQSSASAVIGKVADYQSRINFPRRALVPAVAGVFAGLAGFPYAFAESLTVCVVCFMLVSFALGAYLGPSYSILLATVPSRMRGITSASLQAAINLIGVGLGPLLTGALSDAFGGASSLRPAMAITLCINFWAALHYVLCFRAMKRQVSGSRLGQ